MEHSLEVFYCQTRNGKIDVREATANLHPDSEMLASVNKISDF